MLSRPACVNEKVLMYLHGQFASDRLAALLGHGLKAVALEEQRGEEEAGICRMSRIHCPQSQL